MKTVPSAGMQQRHIAFVSPKCQWSLGFLRELEKTPYMAECKIVDVATLQKPYPPFLKKVPTLVVSNEKNEKEILTDAEVMNWLSLRKLRDSSRTPRVPAGVSAPSAVQQSVPGEPEPFVFSEMGSAGQDPYSFIEQDTTTQGNGGMRIQHNYEYLGMDGGFGGAGGGPAPLSAPQMSAGGGGQKKSKKEEMFDAQMEAYQREREMGMPQVRPRQ
jgi:hypothetical protein